MTLNGHCICNIAWKNHSGGILERYWSLQCCTKGRFEKFLNLDIFFRKFLCCRGQELFFKFSKKLIFLQAGRKWVKVFAMQGKQNICFLCDSLATFGISIRLKTCQYNGKLWTWAVTKKFLKSLFTYGSLTKQNKTNEKKTYNEKKIKINMKWIYFLQAASILTNP